MVHPTFHKLNHAPACTEEPSSALRFLPRSPWTPIVPEQVHKLDPTAVLLESWLRVGPKSYVLQAARSSPHFDRPQPFSLLTGVEMLRQAVILVSHADLAVGPTAAFAMNILALRLSRMTATTQSFSASVLELECSNAVYRAGALRSMQVAVTFSDSEGLLATGGGELAVIPHEIYTRLRGAASPCSYRSQARRLPAEAVGRKRDEDVILAEERSGSLSLVLDTSHPLLFDHPTDHVPGMVLLEAAFQAHAVTAGRNAPAVGVEARFHRYVEFSPPARVEMSQTPDAMHVEFRQLAATAAAVRLLMQS